MWQDVLAAVIREADPEAVRRDLALLARLLGAESPPALSRRDTATLLYRYRRVLARERERALRSWHDRHGYPAPRARPRGPGPAGPRLWFRARSALPDFS